MALDIGESPSWDELAKDVVRRCKCGDNDPAAAAWRSAWGDDPDEEVLANMAEHALYHFGADLSNPEKLRILGAYRSRGHLRLVMS